MRASSSSTIADEIERYLRTGEAHMMGSPWPGDIMERRRRQHADIRGALLAEVRRLAKGRTHEVVPDNVGVEFTRAKAAAPKKNGNAAVKRKTPTAGTTEDKTSRRRTP